MTDSFSTTDDDPRKDRPSAGADLPVTNPPVTDASDFCVADVVPSDSAPFDPVTGVWSIDSEEEAEEKEFDSLDFETNDGVRLEMIGIPARIGEYVIERMIGSGGMGRVYLAKHQTMQRSVAIKTLPPEHMKQKWAVERFYDEVRAAARLMHPNIATAFDAGNSNGIHFLAMEYIAGDTLTTVVAKGGPMSINAAVAAIRGAARGLAHAHSAGVVHRDVKPGNLMLSIDGTIKVVDLGLALFATPHQILQNRRDPAAPTSGRLIGTIAFMSPEQLENPDQVDSRSDIYSLGATLYFLLTGRPPYEGEFLQQIRGIRHDPLPELFALRPDVDLRLEHVFRRMMAKRPQERYASLVEVIADLASYDTAELNTTWITGLRSPLALGEVATNHGGSTNGEVAKVMGIDLGMFYATCAVAEPAGKVEILTPLENGKSQQRLAIADGEPLVFGEAAAAKRESLPGSVLHCIPLYIGQSKVDHLINGRHCPAEVLLAMQIRKLIELCWTEKSFPHAVAITVPSSYDQFHRQAVIQAATIAGVRSIRLVDRSAAVLQSWQHDRSSDGSAAPLSLDKKAAVDRNGERPQVVVSVTGHATEVVVSRFRGQRLQQLSAIGHWHYGTLQWQQKLVDMVAESCLKQFNFDPRQLLQTATALQVACERALPKFLLLESVNISFQRVNKPIAVAVTRADWLDACEPMMVELLQMIDLAMETANINSERVGDCLLLGILTRMGEVRKRIEKKFGDETAFSLVERTDVARGAALCVAGELPGRGDIPLPPQTATTHDIGLLVIDTKNRRRIRPIIPRGTALPARTNRRIAAGAAHLQVLTVVESSTWRETSWRSLGSHRFADKSPDAYLDLTFEVDVDCRLVIRRLDPNSGGLVRLPTLPPPTLAPEEVLQWTEWVRDWMPSPKRRAADR